MGLIHLALRKGWRKFLLLLERHQVAALIIKFSLGL